jgi:hypothetical protein
MLNTVSSQWEEMIPSSADLNSVISKAMQICNDPSSMRKNLKNSKVQHRSLHCKDKILKFRNKYSQKRNIEVSVLISTFMCLWEIYIFPRLVCLFCWRKYVDRSWEYINRSQTHEECGNWGWGRAIPRKGIHKWDFRCSVYWNASHMESNDTASRIFLSC